VKEVNGMRWTLPITLAALALSATGCEEAPPPAAPPASGAAATGQGAEGAAADPAAAAGATGEATSGAEQASELAYAYSPIGKRDPFRSLFDQLQREEQSQQLTELQKFELDQLKLVAIVSRTATPYAMVEDPNLKGHTLTRGTLIGKNWGRVAQINPECVVIKEEYRDYTGRKVTNNTSMCLPKPEELKLD
jgi:type IV pilus assembly protein PilP